MRQRIGVVPILRAGMGMVDPVLRLLPDAEVWHLGIYRDERTLKPVEYYQKLPEDDPVDLALVVDPMLATGGSAVAALGLVERWGAKRVKLLTIIAAPEGIGVVHEAHPEVPIYTCQVDDHLNEHGYIVPGLGDAGDRIFNTGA
jgi:uracil phosphoribosyltransferase